MYDWNNKKCVDFCVNCGPAGRPALFQMWVFLEMVVPPKHTKMIVFSRKPMVVGYHHFRKPPCVPSERRTPTILGHTWILVLCIVGVDTWNPAKVLAAGDQRFDYIYMIFICMYICIYFTLVVVVGKDTSTCIPGVSRNVVQGGLLPVINGLKTNPYISSVFSPRLPIN